MFRYNKDYENLILGVGLLFSSPFFSQIAGGGQQQQQHAYGALYLDDDDNFLATFL
jgi:hypothetical protein